ncbi:MAG: tRNA (pseudouridine(54)-N(1))-methyltransferase TrmY [Candidatus Verstraetearchaeota archaeon]|nr:tRNA (pseudouridine(54)-N(1))-methyltransferase TrmY [Candidatus Verstraetearchaeota archaeon]
MKRIFIVKSSTAFTAPIFNIRSLAGSSGRLDVICRCILNAFFIDRDVFRRNVVFYGVLEGPPDPPKTIVVDGFSIDNMVLDEVWVANVISNLMSGGSFKGFNILRMNFSSLVNSIRVSGAKLIYLHENGVPIDDYNFEIGFDYCFILGDQIGLDRDSEKLLDSMGVPRVSLGRISYLSSQCIWLVNNFMDMLGFE